MCMLVGGGGLAHLFLREFTFSGRLTRENSETLCFTICCSGDKKNTHTGSQSNFSVKDWISFCFENTIQLLAF